MFTSEAIIDAQLIRDCIFAFNSIRNTTLKPDLKTYDLAKRLEETIKQNECTSFIAWGVEDILSIRPDLSAEQAKEVLDYAVHNHDATLGINWEVLDIQADYIFPEQE